MVDIQAPRPVNTVQGDFSRSFLHEKKKADLPHRNDSTSVADASHAKQAAMQRPKLPKPTKSSAQTGVTWARIIDELYEGRVDMQHRANDLLHTQIKKRNHLDDSSRKVVQDMAAKYKEQDWWNYLGNAVETLSIAVTLVGGATLTGVGIASGNQDITKAGYQMTAGGALSLTSKALKQMGVTQEGSAVNRLLSWAGVALSAKGIATGAPILMNRAGTIAAGVASAGMDSVKHGSHARREKIRGELEELNAHLANVQKDRTKSDDDLSNVGSAHKNSDIVHLAKAVTNQEDEKNRVLTRILQGSKA